MVIPYITFQGNCEEAFLFYASIFGGRIEHLSRYSEETGGAALVGQVMHAQVSVGSGALCGADQLEPVRYGEDFKLLVHVKTVAEAETIFRGLSEGGQVLQPLTPHPPPDDGGMGALVRDRYGYIWILTAPNEAKGCGA